MKKCILVADDDSSDLELLLMALQSLHTGLQIYVARDGQEALDFLLRDSMTATDTRPPLSLILLDIKMPRMDGLEVLSVIKSDPRTTKLPVVMFTSSNEGKDVETSYLRGANGYVVKPVDFKEYQDLLAAILGYWLGANRLPDNEAAQHAHNGSPVVTGSAVYECGPLLRERPGNGHRH